MYYFNYTYLGMDVPTVILLMLIYSFIGWIYESTVFSLAEQGKFMNRGCFIGPYCPIYGVACMFSLYLLNGITSGFKIVLIAGLVVSAIEYVTSVVLEKLFHARYWDYSYFPLNINGRVSVISGIFFGLAVLLLIRVIHPASLHLVLKLSYGKRFYLSLSALIVFFLDAVFTTVSMCNLNRKCKELYDAWDRYVEKGLDKLNAKKDNLDKFIVVEKGKNIVVKLKGVNKKFVDLETRYLKTFPEFKSTKYSAVIDKMKMVITHKSPDDIELEHGVDKIFSEISGVDSKEDIDGNNLE